jgi:hypothetical protein
MEATLTKILETIKKSENFIEAKELLCRLRDHFFL